MQLISPDILIEARGLSPGACSFFLMVGMMLWGFGWRWHRFWIVFGITIAAGLIGLSAGRAAAGGQVMAVGILLAVSAGMLALELAKIVAFITGGTAAWIGSTSLLPGIQELWVVFLCGGLLGVVLYRLWTMLATSFIGLMLCWHILFVMAEQFAKFDGPKFAGQHGSAISGALITVTLLGVWVQSWTGRGIGANGMEEAKASDAHAEKPAKNKKEKHDDHGHDDHDEKAGPGMLRRMWNFANSQ